MEGTEGAYDYDGEIWNRRRTAVERKDGWMAYIYMVRCTDASLYTGIAKDVKRRLKEHYYKKKKGARYTRSRQVQSLEMVWETEEWSDAAKLEIRIKRLAKSQKEELILHPEQVSGRFGEALEGIHYHPRPEITLERCLGL